MCCLVRCRCVFYHLCKYFLIMMSATFILLYYLDIDSIWKFFHINLSLITVLNYRISIRSRHYFLISHLFSHVVPVNLAHSRLIYYDYYYTGIHVHTGYTHSVQIFLKGIHVVKSLARCKKKNFNGYKSNRSLNFEKSIVLVLKVK